jgi:hypothetical protein
MGNHLAEDILARDNHLIVGIVAEKSKIINSIKICKLFDKNIQN